MTESEAIKSIKYRMHTAVEVVGNNGMEDLEMAVKVLEEIQQYHAIGTVKECRAAMEKQKGKKPVHNGCYDAEGVWHTFVGINGVPYDLCPNCKDNLCTDGFLGRDKKRLKYCKNCGQKLDWSDEE